MQLVSPLDSLFLIGEAREHPLHVAGLQVFKLPEGAGHEVLREIYAAITSGDVQPAFRKHPARAAGAFLDMVWTVDDELDFEYHVRRSALPEPGRARELLELTSRLHGTLLDRHRPLWEAHLIEGPSVGRFAMYTKVHHSLIDGVTALKMMQRSLSTDPNDREIRSVWTLPPRKRAEPTERPGAMRRFTRGAASVGSMFNPALVRHALREQQLTLPFRAPHTMFNVEIGGSRRCAAQSWPLERVLAVKNAAGVTVNDIVLAMSGGALRRYLAERDALPDTPLIAMVPVSLRAKDDEGGGGNVISTVLCNLGTHLDDPAARLAAVSESMRNNKNVVAEMPRAQATAMGIVGFILMWAGGLPGVRAAPPPFNICISNVPGPREQLYWNGAALEGSYPLSAVMNGQALNITVATLGNSLDFGVVGCRQSVPHLQRLLGHLEAALTELEDVVGVRPAE